MATVQGPLLRAPPEGVQGLHSGPALGLIEVRSLARGVRVADVALKKAAVRLCLCRPVSPGKHLTLLCGGEAEVEEAFRAGLSCAQEQLQDQLLLYQVHEEVTAALAGEPGGLPRAPALGVVETLTAASALQLADVACKAAVVCLRGLRLCDGIGGKGFYLLLGDQAEVEAALRAQQTHRAAGLLLQVELIPRQEEELLAALLGGEEADGSRARLRRGP